MELQLKRPIFIDDRTDPTTLATALKTEQHPYVFIRRNSYFYAVKTVTLLLHTPTEHDDRVDWHSVQTGDPLTVIPMHELTQRALDVLAEEVSLVSCIDGMRYILREDYLLTMGTFAANDELAWLRSIFSSIPRGLMMLGLDYRAVNVNMEALRMLRLPAGAMTEFHMDQLFGEHYFTRILATQSAILNQVITLTDTNVTVLVDFVPLATQHRMTGFALVIQDLPSVEAMAMELGSVKQLNQDLHAILSTIYDEIVVIDGRGTILRVSDNYIRAQWEDAPKLYIGQQLTKCTAASNLVRTVTKDVLSQKKKVTHMDKVGHSTILTVGNPLFDGQKRIDRIVIASRDLTEVSRLRQELEETRMESENYRRELEQMRDRIGRLNGFTPIYASLEMHEVMQKAERVAQFSATVLIQGESGVGKEVVANTIHSFSPRKDETIVKINCAAIPENLLESELFGYEKGAFSGASPQGKVGLFVKADKGTLFLDEISELPVQIQAKLLRAFQEREVYPVGATEPVCFDTRIIVATNKPLIDLVHQDKFREDLFYRINVFPIQIPPLRERKDDVSVLANHFLAQFNHLYQRDMRFTSSAIELLEAYDYPGNVRELQNLVQRSAIASDAQMIDASVLEKIMFRTEPKLASFTAQTARFSRVIPLKQAITEVEEELVTLAMARYRSSVKAAKALGVNQSTVSRKYKSIMARRGRDFTDSDG